MVCAILASTVGGQHLNISTCDLNFCDSEGKKGLRGGDKEEKWGGGVRAEEVMRSDTGRRKEA